MTHYVDTSAVLRTVLERGLTPELERALGTATALVTSRLAIVESRRAFLRARHDGRMAAPALDAAEREADEVWDRCDVWELTPDVCELAARIAPGPLRTLDALHLATFVLARRAVADLQLLTADVRLAQAVAAF